MTERKCGKVRKTMNKLRYLNFDTLIVCEPEK